MTLIISKLLPVILIILIGVLLQRTKEVSMEVMKGIKFIIINIALPCILFFAFVNTKLESRYGLLFTIIFLFCCVLYCVGMLLSKKLIYQFTPSFFSGFEFGMVGIALFTAIWGVEKLVIFTLIGLGHEFFIWFVYVPALEYKNRKTVDFYKTFKSFFTSPIIIAIIMGIIINVFNLFSVIENTLLGGSIFNVLETLSYITVPLILIVIGYSLTFKQMHWKQSFHYISLRLIITILLGTGVYYLIQAVTGHIDDVFSKAFYIFILLPPPYIMPLFIENNEEEIQFFTNTIVLYTLISFMAFIVIVVI